LKQVDIVKSGITGGKKELTDKIVKIYNYHRNNLTESKQSSVLVVPEMLRTLPLNMTGVFKTPFLRPNNVWPVERLSFYFKISSVSTEEVMNLI